MNNLPVPYNKNSIAAYSKGGALTRYVPPTGAKKPSSGGLPVGRHGMGGLGMGLFGLATDTYFNLREGDSVGKAVGKGLINGAAWAIAPEVMMMTQIGAPLAIGAVQGVNALNSKMRSDYNSAMTPGTGFTYRDSRAALTMRQAAVQAIQGSKLNARNALGGEASLMHRGYQR